MTKDEIAAIKARHLRDDWWRNSPSMLSPQMHDDRGALLAEVERLQAERDVIVREWAIETDESLDETVTRNVNGWMRRAKKAEAEVERLREENKRGHAAHKAACVGGDLLREEIVRLRAALEDIARGDYSDPMCQRTPEARARAALEGGR